MPTDITALVIDEAFRALLADNPEATARAISEAQVRHYGMKPWRPGIPTEDITGRPIMFSDFGWRYTVSLVQSDGSHVRTDCGSASVPLLPNAFSIYASSDYVAATLLAAHVDRRKLRDVEFVSAAYSEQFSVIKNYSHGRSLD